jgi:hypothetical protein
VRYVRAVGSVKRKKIISQNNIIMSIICWQNVVLNRCDSVSCREGSEHHNVHLQCNGYVQLLQLKLLYSLRHIQVIASYFR